MHTGIFLLLLAGLGYAVYSVFSGNPARLLYQKGMDLLKIDQIVDAEHYFQEALNMDPFFLEPALELAKIYESQEMWDEAINYLVKAHASINEPFDKRSQEIQMRIGEIYYGTQRYKEAWRVFLILVRQGYISAKVNFYLGELYMVQRRFGEAISYFNEATDLGSSEPNLHYYRGLCLISMREKQDAISALKKVERAPEIAPQVLYLLGKLYFDLNLMDECRLSLGKLLNEKKPIFLQDVLLFLGYDILKLENPSEDDLKTLIKIFQRGSGLDVRDLEIRKEFLYHMAGANILLGNYQEAKIILKDLCSMDSYYKQSDQLFRIVNKPMLQKEDRHELKERYESFQRIMHFDHELTQSLKIEDFYSNRLPLIVLEKLEEQVLKEFMRMVGTDQSLMVKLNLDAPKTPAQLSAASYDIFLRVCSNISEKLGIVVAKNLSKMRNEVIFVGMDKDDTRVLVYFFKPTSVVGTIAIQDLVAQKDKYKAERLYVLCPGGFTQEAYECASRGGYHLFGKQELRKLMY